MIRATLFATLILAGHALAGCDNKPSAGSAPAAPPVTVARPLQKTITEWDEYTGRFEAVERVDVRARVSGFIDSVHFKEGQVVKQGDLLFVIDPRPYRLAVEQAKADVERAKAKLEIASADVQRAARFAIEEIDTTVINGQLNGLSRLEGGSELDTRGHERPLVVSKQAPILSRRSCCPRLC